MRSWAWRSWATAISVTALLATSGCERDITDSAGRPTSVASTQSSSSSYSSGRGGTVAYQVQKGDSIYAIARRHNVQVREIVEANNLHAPYALQVGQRLTIPQAVAARTHTVESGESIAVISHRYRVDQSTLVAANNLQPPYSLRPGQRLTIPQSGAGALAQGSSIGETRYVERVSVPSGMQVSTAPTTSVQATPLEGPSSPPPPRASVESSSASVTASASASPFQTPASAPLSPPPSPSFSSSSSSASVVQSGALPPPSSPGTPPGRPSPSSPSPSSPTTVAAAPVAPPPPPPPAAAPQPPAKPARSERPAPEPEPAEAAPPPRASTAAASSSGAIPRPPARAGTSFLWPVRGKIISTFGPQGHGMHNDGITIAASRGTPIKAPENGVVEYVGSEIRGYGNLLLIRHADGWMSAYAHMESVSVARGDIVRRGQVIGKVGTSGSVAEPQLHFQLRKGSDPVDPEKQLGS